MASDNHTPKPLPVGKLAAAANVGVETVRFYERRGLMPKPRRSPAGYRQYGPEAVERLGFIGRAKALGFTLAEIGELLTLQDTERPCAEVRQRAQRRIDDIGRRVADLLAMKRSLATLVERCEGASTDKCPLIDALSGADAVESADG